MLNEKAQSHLEIYVTYLENEISAKFATLFSEAVENGDREEAFRLLNCATGAYVRQMNYATQVAAFGPSTKAQHAWAADTAKHKQMSVFDAHKSGRYVAFSIPRLQTPPGQAPG